MKPQGRMSISRCLAIVCIASSAEISAQAQILKTPIPDKTVVLTFDDSIASQATIVGPMLKKYGYPATFYITEFPPNFDDKTKYMTWDQHRMLNEMGFEIGNHTHRHDSLGRMDAEQLNETLAYIENTGIKLGIPKPLTFAYPGYGAAEYGIAVLKKRGYIFARAEGSRAYDPLKDHPYLVPSWTVHEYNMNVIMDALKLAKDGKIVVLTFHGVPDNAHANVTVPVEHLEAYLNTLRDNKYNVINMRDLAKYIDVDKALELPVAIPARAIPAR
jgi:hypothetical protein